MHMEANLERELANKKRDLVPPPTSDLKDLGTGEGPGRLMDGDWMAREGIRRARKRFWRTLGWV